LLEKGCFAECLSFRTKIEVEQLCFGGGFFGFGADFFAFEVSLAATAFLDFVMLLSHISLLYGINSVVYREQYEELAVEQQRHFLRPRGGVPFERVRIP
jgi:hypothetical protein